MLGPGKRRRRESTTALSGLGSGSFYPWYSAAAVIASCSPPTFRREHGIHAKAAPPFAFFDAGASTTHVRSRAPRHLPHTRAHGKDYMKRGFRIEPNRAVYCSYRMRIFVFLGGVVERTQSRAPRFLQPRLRCQPPRLARTPHDFLPYGEQTNAPPSRLVGCVSSRLRLVCERATAVGDAAQGRRASVRVRACLGRTQWLALPFPVAASPSP